MNNFREAIEECGLRDAPWEGYSFSYDNGQVGEANRQSMIDRALISSSWLDLYPYAKLLYLNREWSDHAPIKLVLNHREMGAVKSSKFKFEQIWVGEDGCTEAIERGVERGRGDLPRMLEACAQELGAWKRINISKIGRSIGKKLKQLGSLNEMERTVENVHKRRKIVAELATLRKQEEQFWRQRSRALWLKDGDKNTKFFHTRAGERKRKNFIAKLVDDGGVSREGDEGVAGVANAYFQQLFTSSNPRIDNDILQGLHNRVTEDMNAELRRDYSEYEVMEALNQMHPLKAPGPDGMNGLFYQTYWSTGGGEGGSDEYCSFYLTSLCNVAYKLVSKVLANRLKLFLNEIVSENQSAFTPGRAISDNVMIAFEVFHYMKCSHSTEGYMATKLDMAKAYDRVEWQFLKNILDAMGFDRAWVNRVMACVSTVSFSVLINGTPSEEFMPTRGLRQGDPLSPYLFIHCAKALSSMLRRAVERGSLHGVRISNGAPIISHLLFADDSIFFRRANDAEAYVVLDILRRYEYASGQLVSVDKTTVSFSKGIPRVKRSNLVRRLGYVEVEEQERYLGLPTVIGRSKKADAALTDILRDKLSKRLSGWRGKILSRAGKEVLIKAVANSLPTYVMSIFKIPVNFCDELRSLISRFLWGHEEGKQGISWVAWHKLCKTKSRGGMGFRDFKLFNVGLIGKQVRRFMTETDGLWVRLMRAKYYPHGNVMTATLGNYPSYTWRGILEARDMLGSGWRRRIGNGLSTRVWHDAWLVGTQTERVLFPRVDGHDAMVVAELMNTTCSGWNTELISSLFLPFECERIKNIRVSELKPEDTWYWVAEKDGIFSVKPAYRRLAGEKEALDFGGVSNGDNEKWLWKVPVWPRVKLFFWQLCNEALATRANIAIRVRGECSFCSLCNSFLESSVHLFRDCPIAKRVWEGLDLSMEEEAGCGDLRNWVEERWREYGSREHMLFMVGCWALWEHRNSVIFDVKEVNPQGVVRRAREVVEEIEGGGFLRAIKRTEGGREGQVVRKGWTRLPEDFVKVNVDAGVKDGEGISVGVICRNERGEVVWGGVGGHGTTLGASICGSCGCAGRYEGSGATWASKDHGGK
ncbi:uncharacterized protein LOC141589691 [Silene latifolia]|uniref:uncharacterized protein LOC141589691 n=1 Tax=Silene latifolia TaxID=37657 RepID=UPI003D7888E5